MSELFEPKIVGFLCNWCSYAGADLAGTSRLSYPPNIRIVRVPCSGRVDPLFVARALKEGADGVLVLGCHPGDCHYSDGNYVARRRFAVMQELLFFLGFERERVRLDWVSASEGARFARVVTEFTEQVRQLGDGSTAVRQAHRTGPELVEGHRTGPELVEGHRTGPELVESHRTGPELVESHRTGPELVESHRTGPELVEGPAEVRSPTRRVGSRAVEEATQALREMASRLLNEKQVQVVLGWEQGSVRRRPLFARTVEQAQHLLVNLEEPLNLVNYLRNLRGQRTAVLVRPQDARTLNILVSEGQLNRDDLFLIGFATQPPGRYDATLAVPPPPRSENTVSPTFTLAEVEAWSTPRRAAFWQAQFSQCQRCYACRQACPLCYCSECVAEQLDPAWQSIAIDTSEKTFFHILRAFHLAGRCGDCEACTQACPVGVPLYLLNQKVAQEVARLFDGYVAGADPGASLPLTTFRRDEVLAQSGVWRQGHHERTYHAAIGARSLVDPPPAGLHGHCAAAAGAANRLRTRRPCQRHRLGRGAHRFVGQGVLLASQRSHHHPAARPFG